MKKSFVLFVLLVAVWSVWALEPASDVKNPVVMNTVVPAVSGSEELGGLIAIAFIVGIIWFITHESHQPPVELPYAPPVRSYAPPVSPVPVARVEPVDLTRLRDQISSQERTIDDLRQQNAHLVRLEQEVSALKQTIDRITTQQEKSVQGIKVSAQLLRMSSKLMASIEEILQKLESDRIITQGLLQTTENIIESPELKLMQQQKILKELEAKSKSLFAYAFEEYPKVMERLSLEVERFRKLVEIAARKGVDKRTIDGLRMRAESYTQRAANLTSFYEK